MTALVERWQPRTMAVVGAAVSLLPLIAVPWVPVAGDVLAALLTAGGGGLTAWMLRERSRLDALPLQVAAVAARGRIDGWEIFRFRVRLGRGRRMRAPQVRVTWIPDGSDPVPLPVEVPIADLCGPWTVIAVDRVGRVHGSGVLHLQVQVTSGGQDWTAEARYAPDAIVPGTFMGGVQQARRGLVWSGDWDQVTGTVDGSQRPPGTRAREPGSHA